ncbi:hypothetical protein LTR64_005306 [Lithohypha guttulata]|uniref:uncharacterized protein n=1 Tax=Lithohypha guttulata TaxID=1690604 RepID=UPI002DE01BCE|nr:hypothetical protein LTR51_002899 [Lithohypha guttulata]
MRLSTRSTSSLFLTTLSFVSIASAHGGHNKVPEGEAISEEPIDLRLWLHILLMTLTFGLLFPLGMVLGIVRSRWHVPVQTVAAAIFVPAYFLGHLHKGRQFAGPHVHAYFANVVLLMLVAQVTLGAGLKLHLENKSGWVGRVFGGKGGLYGRRMIVIVHGLIGKIFPVVSWTQMLFGGIVAMGYCRGDHLGQCLAHFIMGSAFIGYGIVMTILLLVGQAWIRKTGKSQEFFDSIVIALWGCVNTFTEHRWGHPWVKNDLQHTSMGIIWWCAGLLGIWLSRSRGGRPRRNVIPALVIIFTGWGMSAHPQELPLSTMVHTIFGYSLMAAGAARIIEISFVLRDSRGAGEPNSWQHLTPFLLYASGFLFMGATEEQMAFLSAANVTHVSYILILYSVAFLLYLFVNILLHIYAQHTWPDDESNGQIALAKQMRTTRGAHSRSVSFVPGSVGLGVVNRTPSAIQSPFLDVPEEEDEEEKEGRARINGHAKPKQKPRLPSRSHRVTDSQQVRDAEEFELEGLISDVDEDAEDVGRDNKERKRQGDKEVV